MNSYANPERKAMLGDFSKEFYRFNFCFVCVEIVYESNESDRNEIFRLQLFYPFLSILLSSFFPPPLAPSLSSFPIFSFVKRTLQYENVTFLSMESIKSRKSFVYCIVKATLYVYVLRFRWFQV